jgi:hypothetical protein
MEVPIFEHDSHFIDPKSPETPPIDWTTDIVLRIQWKGGSHDIDRASFRHFDAQRSGLTFSPFGRRAVGILENSVFDDMRKASSELAAQYDWNQEAALRFVLTDEIPSMPAVAFRETGVRGFEYAHLPFEFVIEPWVSPATVLKVFRAVQRKLYGRQSQFLSERTLALFDFVMDDFQAGMTWDDARAAWNKQHASKRGWPYSDYRNMRKDFHRVRWMIAYPGMKPPGQRNKSRKQGNVP